MPQGMDLHCHLVARGSRMELFKRVARAQPGEWVVRICENRAEVPVEVLPKRGLPIAKNCQDYPLEDLSVSWKESEWQRFFVYRGELRGSAISKESSYEAWSEFTKRGFNSVRKLLGQRNVMKDIFLPLVMEELVEQKVMGVELRLNPFNQLWSHDSAILEDASGKEYIGLVVEAAKRKGIECNIILSFNRRPGSTMPANYLQLVQDLLQSHGEHIKGFDFVGHEDSGTSLRDFGPIVDELKALGLEPILHAGESNQYQNSRAKDNIMAAVEMGAFRMGHCLAGAHDPDARAAMKGVWRELCPVSNLVLQYCPEDQRTACVNAEDVDLDRTVIGTDDPAVTDTTISTDFALFSLIRNLTLEQILKLQANSIQGSCCTEDKKEELLRLRKERVQTWLASWCPPSRAASYESWSNPIPAPSKLSIGGWVRNLLSDDSERRIARFRAIERKWPRTLGSQGEQTYDISLGLYRDIEWELFCAEWDGDLDGFEQGLATLQTCLQGDDSWKPWQKWAEILQAWFLEVSGSYSKALEKLHAVNHPAGHEGEMVEEMRIRLLDQLPPKLTIDDAVHGIAQNLLRQLLQGNVAQEIRGHAWDNMGDYFNHIWMYNAFGYVEKLLDILRDYQAVTGSEDQAPCWIMWFYSLASRHYTNYTSYSRRGRCGMNMELLAYIASLKEKLAYEEVAGKCENLVLPLYNYTNYTLLFSPGPLVEVPLALRDLPRTMSDIGLDLIAAKLLLTNFQVLSARQLGPDQWLVWINFHRRGCSRRLHGGPRLHISVPTQKLPKLASVWQDHCKAASSYLQGDVEKARLNQLDVEKALQGFKTHGAHFFHLHQRSIHLSKKL
ncbi:unnamed protein product [Polarella glacialis]|uniref:Adenosine deaminase domain-containing protein n=1 Tax=Polarella glacialis TaxID=89957 RepID=A0A813G6T6_POLGL|nr:unnamed protein product [Polarella glacialis]